MSVLQAFMAPTVRTELGWWPSLPEGWRDTPEYSRWRAEVWRRHGSRCKGCGSTDNLEAHHVYPASTCEGQPGYPHLVFDPSNGVLACRACHIRIDPWLFHCLLVGRLKETDRAKLAARARRHPGFLRRTFRARDVDVHQRRAARQERQHWAKARAFGMLLAYIPLWYALHYVGLYGAVHHLGELWIQRAAAQGAALNQLMVGAALWLVYVAAVATADWLIFHAWLYRQIGALARWCVSLFR